MHKSRGIWYIVFKVKLLLSLLKLGMYELVETACYCATQGCAIFAKKCVEHYSKLSIPLHDMRIDINIFLAQSQGSPFVSCYSNIGFLSSSKKPPSQTSFPNIACIQSASLTTSSYIGVRKISNEPHYKFPSRSESS